MTLPVFVVDSEVLSSDVIEVAGEEGRHAAVVRRLRAGERILLTDGCGHGAECVVVSTSKGLFVAEVVGRLDEAAPAPRVTVVQALIKGDSGVQAVDLMTQVGVDVVVPWAAARCVVQWRVDDRAGEHRGDQALRRWRATAKAAGKQARRLRFLNVEVAHTTEQVAALLGAADLAVVLHEAADTSVTEVAMSADGLVVLVVGPEGGLTEQEVATFAAAGAVPVRLGPSVLRASAAGAVGAAVLLSRTPRWRPAPR
jgi:16S rRNA (uracil1498-N3)-methyltransferase